MNELFRREALTRCPACDYDLTGATGVVCPECGYAVSEEDVALDGRRRMLLELAPGMIAWRMLLVAAAVAISGFWPIIFVGQAAIAGRVITRGVPRLHARVYWRIWLMTLVWLQLVWVAPVAMAAWREWFGYGFAYSYTFHGRDIIREGLPAATAGLIAGVLMWRWSWSRLCSAAGMPRESRPRARMNAALRIAVGPQGLLVLIVAIFTGILWVCDTLVPGWEYMVSR